jgi:hypothetical protein
VIGVLGVNMNPRWNPLDARLNFCKSRLPVCQVEPDAFRPLATEGNCA